MFRRSLPAMSKRRHRTASPPLAAVAQPPAETAGKELAPWQVHALRAWLVLMFVVTLRWTWPLWSERTEPPLLPLVEWPQFTHFGTILSVTAVASLFWPRAALAAGVSAGLAAMTADQTRMQPQIFSLWLLMLGMLPYPIPRFIGRCHLASLWFFSGFHKLLSPGYYRDVAPFLWRGLFPPEDWPGVPDLAVPLATGMAVIELVLGVVVFVPRLRRAAAVVIVLLHCSVVWLLHRHDDWNTSVWPWNWALSVVGATLIASWKNTLSQEKQICGTAGFATGVALFLSPLLFYAGLLDAYLSHCLYSANVPVATMRTVEGRPAVYRPNGLEGPYWSNVNVPQPPAHRIFAEYFRRVARPGDRMLVEDSRWWAAVGGWDRYLWQYTGTEYRRVRLPPPSHGP